MLSQAGGDAEETLNAARTEAEETLRSARTEADRMVTSARNEAERMVEGAHSEAEATLSSARSEAESTVASANAEAYSTLNAAQQRAAALDETTGRRVSYLTDTHQEVMRRLHEMGAVLGDLIHRESSAGELVDEASVLPVFRVQTALPVPAAPVQAQTPEITSGTGPDASFDAEPDASSEVVHATGGPEAASDVSSDIEAVRVIVDEDDDGDGDQDRDDQDTRHVEVYDDTVTNQGQTAGKTDEEAEEEYAATRRR
jgi:F0F1-type ATP synthase membrane subunit b/b'